MINQIEKWQEKLGIARGMSKEEALEKFREWRGKMKTCERCMDEDENKKYVQFCPIHLICEEADNEQRNVEGNDNRGRIVEANESKALRTIFFEGRKRDAIR